MRVASVAFACLVIGATLGTVLFVEPVAAQTASCNEGFESFTALTSPPFPVQTEPNSSCYTFSHTGNSYVRTAHGSKVLYSESAATSTFTLDGGTTFVSYSTYRGGLNVEGGSVVTVTNGLAGSSLESYAIVAGGHVPAGYWPLSVEAKNGGSTLSSAIAPIVEATVGWWRFDLAVRVVAGTCTFMPCREVAVRVTDAAGTVNVYQRSIPDTDVWGNTPYIVTFAPLDGVGQIDGLVMGYTRGAIGAAFTTQAFAAGYVLVGASVDYSQRGVIARLAGASDEKIFSYDPVSLGVTASMSNGCQNTRPDGVMATVQDPPGIPYLGSLDCIGTASASDVLDISSTTLGDPDQTDTLCTSEGGSFCAFYLDSEQNDGCQTNGQFGGAASEIGQVLASPLSYRAGFSFPGEADQVRVGMLYDTREAGGTNIGVFTQTMISGSQDRSCWTQKPFSGNTNGASQICGWRNDGNDYVSAVDVGAPTLTWQITFTQPIGAFQPNWEPVMTQASQLSPASGIGCGDFGNYTLQSRLDGTLNMYRTVNGNLGSALWPASLTDAATTITRGVALSRNAQWGAYVKTGATEWAVINATNGAVLGTGAMPSGNFKQMWLTGNGKDLFIATSTKISRFHVATATGTENTADSCFIVDNGCVNTGSDATPTTTVVGDVSSSACGGRFTGTVLIGSTYVPLLDWTNCASMAVETIATMLILAACVAVLQIKGNGMKIHGIGPTAVLLALLAGYFVSLFLWQAPIWPILAATAVGVGIMFIRARTSGESA